MNPETTFGVVGLIVIPFVFDLAVVVTKMFVCRDAVVVILLVHGTLHFLGQEAISDGVEHVKITHSEASCIEEEQLKNWQRLPEKPGKHVHAQVMGF